MEKKTTTVTLPDYFSIKHYKALGSFEHLDDLEKIIMTVSALTERDVEEIERWSLTDLMKIYSEAGRIMHETGGEFYPVFEFKDIIYGFQPLSKMTVAEFIDLERRLKDPVNNLEEILAILYRPIKSHKFNSLEWMHKSYIKILKGENESMFKYYEVEEYDTETRDWRVDIFKDLPLEYCIGVLSFFLGLGMQLSLSSIISSEDLTMKEKEEMLGVIEGALQSLNTMGGSTSSETLTQQES